MVYVVLDDVGFSAMGCYGGPIETPNASGTIPPENGMLPEILGERGWNTYMVGKWHLCPSDAMNLAASRRNWPSGRGFERWYGFLGAETSQWYPDLVYGRQRPARQHPGDRGLGQRGQR